MSNPFTTKDALTDVINQVVLGEKTLTNAEKKKREEIAQAMERENPGMDMGKKMAIATAQAKKVAEEVDLDEASAPNGKASRFKPEKSVERGVHDDSIKGHADVKKTAVSKFLQTRKGDGKVRTEEVENLDELSQLKLANYVAKAATSLHNNAKEAGQYDDKENANKAFKRYLGIKSAAVRLRGRGELPGKQSAIGAYPSMKYKTEEVDQDEDLEMFLEEYTTMFNEAEDTQQLTLLRAMAQDPSELMKMKRALNAGDKAMTNPVLRGEILKMLDQMMKLTTTDKSLLQRTRAGFQKAKSMPEEVELDEQRVIDMKGKTCTKCSKGKYGKDHPDDDDHYDDLSCKSCGHKTERYTTLLTLAQKKKKTNEEVVLDESEQLHPKVAKRSKDLTDAGHTVTFAGQGYDKLTRKKIGQIRYQDKNGAKINKTFSLGEDVEELDELSKDTLGSYIKKANSGERGSTRSAFEAGKTYSKAGSKYNRIVTARANKRMKGINQATDKLLAKEDVEQVDEVIGAAIVGGLVGTALGAKGAYHAAKHTSLHSKKPLRDYAKNFAKGVLDPRTYVPKKKTNEEVEQIDELKKDTMGSYIKKATSDVANKAVRYSADAAKVSAIVHHQRTDADYDKLRAGERGMAKRSKGIDLAVKKLTKEDVEQIDESSLDNCDIHKCMRLHTENHKNGNEHVLKAIEKHVKQKYGAEAHKKMVDNTKEHAAYLAKGGVYEEVEQIDEAKKTTHEDPLITVHKDGRLHAHAHLSTINDIHGTDVKHTAIHAGGAKVKTKYGDNLEYKLSRHHAKGVQESVVNEEMRSPSNAEYNIAHKFMKKKANSSDLALAGIGVHPNGNIHVHIVRKDFKGAGSHHVISKEGHPISEEADKTAPFEGGRETTSKTSAAKRVKKIAKGMKKQYTKDKK